MKMDKLVIFYGVVVIALSSKLIKCQLKSPCPTVFEYKYRTAENSSNEIYGAINAKIAENTTNEIKLEVEVSVEKPVPISKGNIYLSASLGETFSDLARQKPLRYVIYFPTWTHIPPKITKISVNGKEICKGSSVEDTLSASVTSIVVQHTLPLLRGTQTPTNKPDSTTKQSSFNFIEVPTMTKPPPKMHFQKNPFFTQSSTSEGVTPESTQKPKPSIPNKPKVETLSGVPTGLVHTDSDIICGTTINTNSLLINGQKFARNLHPWLAALFQQVNEGLKFICGTSLISKRHVVTAAHCVRRKKKKLNPEELWVVLGRENLQQWSNDGAQMIQAQSTHYNPGHQFHTADADIAVILLSEEVVFNPYVRPVCLWDGSPDKSAIVGQSGTVAGWGKDETGQIFTPEPRLITLPVVSEEDCLRSNRGFLEITSNRTFCAGNRDDSGPCNGDSGSGFLLKKSERWYLRGVVSMSLAGADGNCDLKQYIVFTDAARYLEWIQTFLR